MARRELIVKEKESSVSTPRMFHSVFSDPTFEELILSETRVKVGAASSVDQLRNYRDAESRLISRAGGLQNVEGAIGIKPAWMVSAESLGSQLSGLSHEEAKEEYERRLKDKARFVAENFVHELTEGAGANLVGEIRWKKGNGRGLNDMCEFDFYEQHKSYGVLKNVTTNKQLTHWLEQARRHPLPANSVKKPKRCRQLIKAMYEHAPFLTRHAYIVTGYRAEKFPREVARVEEDSHLVRGVKAAGRKINKAMATTAKAVREANERWQERRREQAELDRWSRDMILRYDPALVISERLVLCGWD